MFCDADLHYLIADNSDEDERTFHAVVTKMHLQKKEVTCYFDNCVSQSIPIHWVKHIVGHTVAERKRNSSSDELDAGGEIMGG